MGEKIKLQRYHDYEKCEKTHGWILFDGQDLLVIKIMKTDGVVQSCILRIYVGLIM
jgi:hypothetical protein